MGRGPGVRVVGRSLQIDFRYRGVRCRERLRLEPTARNIKYATNLKARIEHEIQTGSFDYQRHFPNSKRLADKSRRLGGLLQHFLGRVRVSPETAEEYAEYVELVPESLKEKAINQITQQDIEAWLEPLNYSRKRINNLLIPLRATFRKAYRDREIQVNPLQGIKLEARKTEAQIDPFTREELEALGGPWKFWGWTGLRSGEFAGLRWGDLESGDNWLQIRRSIRVGREKSPKTRAGTRRIQLLRQAREACGVRGPDDGPIWTNPATGLAYVSDRQIREAFRRRCLEVGVRYRYPYQLRHTHASIALSAGENPLWVAKQLGHKDVSMVLKVYGRYLPEYDPMAGKRMEAYGESDGKPKTDAP